jgi:hypothetical protein
MIILPSLKYIPTYISKYAISYTSTQAFWDNTYVGTQQEIYFFNIHFSQIHNNNPY